MGQYSKQAAIYIGILLVSATFTLIAPFYPEVADHKGLPLWMIGVVFALNPFAKVTISPIIGKYLNHLGRKRVILASFLLTSLSMFVLSPIEYLDTTLMIVFSVLSRLIGGIGSSCLLVSIVTVCISDYPDQMQIMIGRIESAIGVGLMIGPVLGTGLYYINLLAALLIVGTLVLFFSPVAWKMLGVFRVYKIQEVKIDRIKLLFRPVKIIQKIICSVFMCVLFLFSFGFLATILEIHLGSYGLNPLFVALCFTFESSIYLTLSLSGGYLFGRFDPRLVMLTGSMSLALAFLMLGPWSLIFPSELWVIMISLPLFAIGQSMTYMFSIPYMVRSAVDCYGYPEDDILTDVVSSFGSSGTAFGEIIGPLFAGFVSQFLGIETCCVLASLCNFLYGVLFFFVTGYAADLIKGRKTMDSRSVVSSIKGKRGEKNSSLLSSINEPPK